MTYEYKATQTEFKAEGDQGEFEGHFAVFGNVDEGGDIAHPGMFARTIQERGRRVKFFYAHDWNKLIAPPPHRLNEDGVGLFAAGKLTLGSFWGKETWALMKDGALTEGSFGYEAVKFDYDGEGVRNLREVKLFELSPVPLGMNPLTELRAVKALLEGQHLPLGMSLYDALLGHVRAATKGALPPHNTPKADEGIEWDAGAVLRQVEGAAALRRIHAWVDEDGDPEVKSSYKLPHHTADGKVVLRAVQAAGGALMGGRGGVNLPESDMAGVKRHLQTHYHQFDRQAPWEEEAGLEAFLELPALIAHELKIGRVLSAANVEKARGALSALQEAIDALTQLLASAEPEKTHSAIRERRARVAHAALAVMQLQQSPIKSRGP